MKINYRLEIVLSGMLLTGTTQKYVANKLGKDTRTVRRCGYDTIVRKTFNIERGLEGPIAKKAVQDPHSKSLGKRHKSTRFIVNKSPERVLLSQKTLFVAI